VPRSPPHAPRTAGVIVLSDANFHRYRIQPAAVAAAMTAAPPPTPKVDGPRRWEGGGLGMTSDGHLWHARRRLGSPSFSPNISLTRLPTKPPPPNL